MAHPLRLVNFVEDLASKAWALIHKINAEHIRTSPFRAEVEALASAAADYRGEIAAGMDQLLEKVVEAETLAGSRAVAELPPREEIVPEDTYTVTKQDLDQLLAGLAVSIVMLPCRNLVLMPAPDIDTDEKGNPTLRLVPLAPPEPVTASAKITDIAAAAGAALADDDASQASEPGTDALPPETPAG